MNYENKIIAVDFDGTAVTHEYPEIGKDIGAVPVLKELVSQGARIILWTIRSGPQLTEAVEWFKFHGIPLWGINENPQQKSWSQSPKAYANLFIDDAALGAPLIISSLSKRPYMDWKRARTFLFSEPE